MQPDNLTPNSARGRTDEKTQFRLLPPVPSRLSFLRRERPNQPPPPGCTMILDFIDLSSDSNEHEDAQEVVKGDVVDLCSEDEDEGAGEEEHAAHSVATERKLEAPSGFHGHGGAADSATTPQRLEAMADDGQGSATRCVKAPQMKGYTAQGQSIVVHCGETQESNNVSDDVQGDFAPCTPAMQRMKSPVAHSIGSAAQSPLSGAEQEAHRTSSVLDLPPRPTALPFPQQFWKAGDYILAAPTATDNGQNRMCVHPKFLHSNATSHKWVFGAIAELLDNAVDVIQNGATFVKIDKIKHAPDSEYSLTIQDDGGGMSPESLRRCMSFGFSHKHSSSSIGEYGNGFKTSTMRLGADVIVFTCKEDADNKISLSVGLLSYTFLMRKRCNDILIPAVDYKCDAFSSSFERIMNYGEKHFLANLSVLLEWSPFSTEEELFNQFRCMKFHGTKIVVFNLWLKDERDLELDFITDDEDIVISGVAPAGCGAELKQMHVANRFRYSLRVEVITTIGYLKGAPKLDVYGFNVYHKNRLILPFWPAGSYKHQRKGISGVLETNFIKPTHDKQDFEKTELFQRLETRLKDMAMEYWRHHCHLVGYTPIAKGDPPSYYVSTTKNNDESLRSRAATNIYNCNSTATAFVPVHPCLSRDILQGPMNDDALTDQMDHDACPRTRINVGTALPINAPQQAQTELCRRRNSAPEIYWRAEKRQKNYNGQPASGEQRVIVAENRRLKAECSELEATVQQLALKANEFRKELEACKRRRKELGNELQACDRKEASLHQHHSSIGG